jgi:hypothetical protein
MTGTDSQSERTASCLCGNLQAVARGEPEAVYLCSCLDCQRKSGSAFTYAALYAESAVRGEGEFRAFRRRGDSGRFIENQFCPTCGVTVLFLAEGMPGFVGIAAGCFADPDFAQPSRLYWAGRHHDWLVLPESIAREDTQ